MALYKWQCTKCGMFSRDLQDTRPVLLPCVECGGEQQFVTKASTAVKEVIDSWTMTKAIERYTDIEEKIAERNALADQEASTDVPIV